jgi:hypothetical protein
MQIYYKSYMNVLFAKELPNNITNVIFIKLFDIK